MALRNTGNKIAVNDIISNVSVNIIEITEDKLVNILSGHVNRIKKSNDWIGSVALFVSLMGIFLTSDFHDTWKFSKDMLQAFFGLVLVVSFVYMLYTVFNCIRNRSKVEDIVADIKGGK